MSYKKSSLIDQGLFIPSRLCVEHGWSADNLPPVIAESAICRVSAHEKVGEHINFK